MPTSASAGRPRTFGERVPSGLIAAEAGGALDELGDADGRGVDRDLVGPRVEQHADVVTGPRVPRVRRLACIL